MRRLTLVVDHLLFSWRTRVWLDGQPKYVPIEVFSTDNPTLAARLPALPRSALDGRLTLVDDDGNVWRDGAAELTVLWALRRRRAAALRIGHPSRLAFRRGNLDWLAGGAGEPWPEGRTHGAGAAG